MTQNEPRRRTSIPVAQRPAADGADELVDRVVESRRARTEMIARFGLMPVSILRLSRGALSRSLFNLPSEKRRGSIGGNLGMARVDPDADYKSARSKATAKNRKALGVVGGAPGMTKLVDGARATVSVMPGELVDFVLNYYGTPGQMYLDPFAGQGVQLQVAALRGFDYIGMDACVEYVDYIETVIDRMRPTTTAVVHRGDSRFPDLVADRIGDVCFTSPPYWDTEYYGPEAEQLGAGSVSYEDFMVGMEDVYRAWLPKFKPGAWVIVNVNDIRRRQVFYPYHADTTLALRAAGYAIHDTWVVEGLISGLARIYSVRNNLRRIAPKIHEYLVVART